YMHTLLQQTPVVKTYHALTLGGPEADCGMISAPIARREKPSLLRHIHPDGKEAVTEYWVLERGTELCKLALRPVTGRTHQLRVHCSYMGFPIIGDPQYGSEESRFGLESQMLCARILEFTHPMTRERLLLVSQMDTEL
ncbi:MAG: RNA pseudouridine synthase, partial [Oscillospiraceae bacterium]|nr:RNA pseudouridine synthase [Oscillospiraceae bacterium]